MTFKPMPPADYLRRIFNYDPETGILYWNYREDVPKATNTRFAGCIAGSYDKGYLTVRLNNVLYMVHRVAFVIYHGDILGIEDEIDHEDLNGCNNKIRNMRKATDTDNNANKDMQVNNTSGSKSIDQLPSEKWRARIAGLHLGCYDTIQEATEAYGQAAETLYGKFGRLSLLP